MYELRQDSHDDLSRSELLPSRHVPVRCEPKGHLFLPGPSVSTTTASIDASTDYSIGTICGSIHLIHNGR
eukprot:9755527-Prorocentrum_lima.AAC.1